MALEQQRPAQKIGNIVFERYVYDGPQGTGFLDFEYKIVAGEIQQKIVHTGPEIRPVHDFQDILDFDVTKIQITGTTTELLDVVKIVETPPGSGSFQRIIVQETHQVAVFGPVVITVKHPYKALFFGL